MDIRAKMKVLPLAKQRTVSSAIKINYYREPSPTGEIKSPKSIMILKKGEHTHMQKQQQKPPLAVPKLPIPHSDNC